MSEIVMLNIEEIDLLFYTTVIIPVIIVFVFFFNYYYITITTVFNLFSVATLGFQHLTKKRTT